MSYINNTKAICVCVLLKGGSFQSIRVAASLVSREINCVFKPAFVCLFAQTRVFTTRGNQTRIGRFYLTLRCSYFLIFVATSLVLALDLHYHTAFDRKYLENISTLRTLVVVKKSFVIKMSLKHVAQGKKTTLSSRMKLIFTLSFKKQTLFYLRFHQLWYAYQCFFS